MSTGIDASVGGLVWVQRRNGSWWPGQIIDVDEASENLMASPKCGTPIKLLGRSEAIVDWYNLEKSKRVKSFRCGEYDACIEKAKLAAANSARKSVKYARREDAIIHALDIEMTTPSAVASLFCQEREHKDNEFSGFNGNNNPVQDLIEDPNQERPRRTPNDSEDDGTEGVKRMRGLNDLGMGVAQKMKREKTQMGQIHELSKRKDRRKPLSKVLESASMVSVPVVCEFVRNNSDSTGILCENRILRNASESVIVSCKHKGGEISRISEISEKASSLELFDVPLLPEKKQPSGLRGQRGQNFRAESLSLVNEELNDSVSTSSDAADGIEKSNSKWQSKGKRNSRNTVRTKKINNIANDCNNNNFDEYWGWNDRSSTKVADKKLLISNSLNTQRLLPYRQSRSTMNPKYSHDYSITKREDSYSDLYDVCVEVKATSRPQHVPYISLQSKLTGQPIIGHPLTVEVLEEGSADTYIISSKRKIFVAPKHLKSHRVSPVKSRKLRKSATSSKKIRKLSSLSGFSRLSGGERNLMAEKIMKAAVACVPLKVVFSRINAYLRGLMRLPKRVAKLCIR